MILYHATTAKGAERILKYGFMSSSFTDDISYASTYLRPSGVILVADIPESMIRSRGEGYDEWVLRRSVKLPLPGEMFRVAFKGHFLELLERVKRGLF